MTIESQLSSFRRNEILDQLSSSQLDCLVIGGGITGAGIALDAASRGLKVGLLEKQDFGAGTSSKSTKLIHGGLRYLKQGEVGLVREVGRERAILYQNAPHVVIPEKMLLPLVKKGTYGSFATSIGLWIYDWLAGVKKSERRKMLSKENTSKHEPLLRKDILLGGGLYSEYRTDDARLTVEVMKTAAQKGALCVNYTEVEKFIYDGGTVIGVKATDAISEKTYTIYAKKIINATGPWVDQLREKDNSLYGKRLHHTKGVHLVVPYERLPLKQSVYFDVSDGRMIFAIPRFDTTYIGTTDTDYRDHLEKPVATRNDVDYLLKAVNGMFPSVKLTPEDVISSWAGLRPLIHEDGKSASELSRKDEIIVSPSGLITIAGGKLTGYRKMAERVVDLTLRQLSNEGGHLFVPCTTDKIVLSGGNFNSPDDVHSFIGESWESVSQLGIDRMQVAKLVRKYGTNTSKVLEVFRQLLSTEEHRGKDPDILLCLAELQYTTESEMVMTPNDFFIRRSGMLYFDRKKIERYFPALIDHLAKMLGWKMYQKRMFSVDLKENSEIAVRFK